MDEKSPHKSCLMHDGVERTLTDHENWLRGLDKKFNAIIILLVLNLGGILANFIIK